MPFLSDCSGEGSSVKYCDKAGKGIREVSAGGVEGDLAGGRRRSLSGIKTGHQSEQGRDETARGRRYRAVIVLYQRNGKEHPHGDT